MKTTSGTATIRSWKLAYDAGGMETLRRDKRGGDKLSGISAGNRQAIKMRASRSVAKSFCRASARRLLRQSV